MSDQLALIVEDDNFQAALLAKAVQAAGFETEIIQTGDAALARLAIVVPDMVVLDLNLPGVDGTDILHQVRADARLAGIRVIIVTGEPQMAEVIQDEADLVLIKPINFAQLRDLAVRLRSSTSPDK